MAKFSDLIGYVQEAEETEPGVWTNKITEKRYYGDVLRQSKRWRESENVNDDLVISNRISIVADEFACSNFSSMRYVIWNGVYWEVKDVEVQRPRLILSIGGVYNGPKNTTPE
jgi:hypothetical protein